jgi:6,7-dimethyl-8-ribityllumazine synthase
MAEQATRIAFVQSSWHSQIVDCGREGFVTEMGSLGFQGRLRFRSMPGASLEAGGTLRSLGPVSS